MIRIMENIFTCEKQKVFPGQVHPTDSGFELTQENCKHLFNNKLFCLKCELQIPKD